MSKKTAAKKLRESGKVFTHEDLLKEQKKTQKEWSGLGEHASNHGKDVHTPLENYGKGLLHLVDKSFYPLGEEIYKSHLQKYKWFNEFVFFLENEKIAGTADLPIVRKNSLSPVIDIDDFKTNVRRGIEFSDPYGKYMKGPLSHLEDCNYNHYALQLSLYGYMAVKTFGVRIGSLNIRYIKAELKDGVLCPGWSVTTIPVPFMYHEIEAMLKYHQLSNPITEEEPYIFEP